MDVLGQLHVPPALELARRTALVLLVSAVLMALLGLIDSGLARLLLPPAAKAPLPLSPPATAPLVDVPAAAQLVPSATTATPPAANTR